MQWEGTFPGDVGDPIGAVGGAATQQFRVVFTVHAARETRVPDTEGNPPDSAEMTAIAQKVHDEADAIRRGLRKGMRDGHLFGHCAGKAVTAQVAIDPMGGIAGSVTTVEVSL